MSQNISYVVDKEDLAKWWSDWLSEKDRIYVARIVRDYYLTKTLALLNKKEYNNIEKLEWLMEFHLDLMQGIQINN